MWLPARLQSHEQARPGAEATACCALDRICTPTIAQALAIRSVLALDAALDDLALQTEGPPSGLPVCLRGAPDRRAALDDRDVASCRAHVGESLDAQDALAEGRCAEPQQATGLGAARAEAVGYCSCRGQHALAVAARRRAASTQQHYALVLAARREDRLEAVKLTKEYELSKVKEIAKLEEELIRAQEREKGLTETLKKAVEDRERLARKSEAMREVIANHEAMEKRKREVAELEKRAAELQKQAEDLRKKAAEIQKGK